MRVTRLRVGNVRRLEQVELEPGPGLNLLVGDNGAGKTSVLEALHLMAYGRSFRGRVRDGLVRTGTDALEIYVEWNQAGGERARRGGLRHSGAAWEARLDGDAVSQLGELCAALAVVTFEPGSHALVGGSAEPRRRFMDWGLFHVEQDFLALWRRYSRALRQRNSLLKQGAPGKELDVWDVELVATAEPLTAYREGYLDGLAPAVTAMAERISPLLGRVDLQFVAGWKRDQMSLEDALLLSRDRDRAMGHTTVGPHRADWRLFFSAMPGGEPLSRGQAKLAALSCLLAQARHLAVHLGEWPVVALDDLASELDGGHRERVFSVLAQSDVQVFVTGTEAPGPVPSGKAGETRMFHVEQGRVARV